ncbi:TPA: hypothetical protein ACS72K_001786 [Providencia alcalifaciens]
MCTKIATKTQHVDFNKVPSTLSNKNQSKGISLDSVKSVENKPNIPLKSVLKQTNAQENVSKVTKKTIHKKDTKALNKQADEIISKIRFCLDAIVNNNSSYRSDLFSKQMNHDLQQLKNIAMAYNDKLESSSYNHHQSKRDAITEVNTEINNIQSIVEKADKLRQKNNASLEKEANAQKELVSQTPRPQSVKTETMSSYQQKQQRAKDYAEYGYK